MKRWRLVVSLCGVVLSAWFAIPAAASPSFDCSKATVSAEKVICSNPELSDADGKLSELYASARQTREGDAAQTLIKEQETWLAERGPQCHLDAPQTPTQFKLDCLKAFYRDRIAELTYAAEKNPKIADTDYRPDFWGMDPISNFPQLQEEGRVYNVPYIFEDNNGNIIVRVVLLGNNKSPKGYDIDIFGGKIFKSINEANEIFDANNDVTKNGWKILDGDKSIIIGNYSYIAATDLGGSKHCDQLPNSLSMVNNINKHVVRKVFLVRRIHLKKEGKIGGAWCDPPSPIYKVSIIAENEIPRFSVLKDGTILAFIGGSTVNIVRFDRSLHTVYRSTNFIVLSGWRREALPGADDVDAAQKFLLSLF